MSDLIRIKNALSQAAEAKNKKAEVELRKYIMETVGKDITASLSPILRQIAEQSDMSRQDITYKLKDILSQIKIELPEIKPQISVNTPDVIIPPIKVPEPRVTVNIPKMDIADIIRKIEMPEKMNVEGWVRLMGVDLRNPLPVQLRDAEGKPLNLFENMTQIISGGGGGKADFFTIKGFNQSAYAEMMNADGRLRVSVETGGSGITDAELRASSVPVEQVSGSIWSTYITGIFNSTTADVINPDNRIKVELPTGSSGLTDVELRASSVPVEQVSGSRWSTEATQSGTWNIATVTGITNSVGATLLNGDGTYRDTFPIQGTVIVSDITASVKSALIDSSGVQYSGANPIPTYLVAGSGNSTISVGDLASDAVDTGSSPVKVGGIARTANPTAVAGGDRVSFSADDLGRQINRPIQVRDLIATAYVSKTSGSTFGTETTLLASGAGTFLDLIYVMGTNDSTAAIQCDLRASTAGTILCSIVIPAGGTSGMALPVPIPAPFVDHTWTIDLPDVTGTNVTITALFSKEV